MKRLKELTAAEFNADVARFLADPENSHEGFVRESTSDFFDQSPKLQGLVDGMLIDINDEDDLALDDRDLGKARGMMCAAFLAGLEMGYEIARVRGTN